MTTMTDRTPTPLLVDARTAARMLSFSERTLWSLTAPRGPIHCIRVSKRGVRYAVADLERFIESHKEQPRQEVAQ